MEPNEAAPGEDNRDDAVEEQREGQDGITSEEFDLETLRNILEGVLLAAARPLSLDQMQSVLGGETAPDKASIRRALEALEADCAHRGIELVEVASGFRLQVRQEIQTWVSRLWEERPPRYSRALLETLALIAYRQPITRGEIEDVRGVSVSTNIIRQLEEREWIRVVGHRDVPGKPALFGTTKAFLDYFGLKSLDELPSLAEIRDIDSLEPEFDFGGQAGGEQADGTREEEQATEAGDGEAEAADGAEALEQQAEAAAATGEPAGTTPDEPEPEEGGDTATADDEAEEPSSGEATAPEAPADERPGSEDADSDDRDADGDGSVSDNAAASGGRH